MEKYNDRLDGFTPQEYNILSQAYNEQNINNNNNNNNNNNGILVENIDFFDNQQKTSSTNSFNNDNFKYSPITIQNNEFKDNALNNNDNNIISTPQINYVGLNDTEKRWLCDLVQDLRQYYNEDYGLIEFIKDDYQENERPLLYFVSKHKILTKIVNLLCSIFDKAKRNSQLNELLNALIILSRQVNSK